MKTKAKLAFNPLNLRPTPEENPFDRDGRTYYIACSKRCRPMGRHLDFQGLTRLATGVGDDDFAAAADLFPD